jgi:hypothetical protein
MTDKTKPISIRLEKGEIEQLQARANTPSARFATCLVKALAANASMRASP